MIVRMERTHLKSNLKSIHNVSPLGRENAEKQLQSPKLLYNRRSEINLCKIN